MMNIEYKAIRNLSIVAALLLAPILCYGSAYMLYSQIGDVSDERAKSLVKAPVQQNHALPDDLKAQIAAAIDLAEPNG